MFLCLALILAGGFHAADITPVQSHEYQVHASTVDDHSDPCKTGSDHKWHTGCLASAGCINVMMTPDVTIAVANADRMIWPVASFALAGHSITPLFHPPKLSAAT
jgi:hypothetical protein